jgi:hypothetical protein
MKVRWSGLHDFTHQKEANFELILKTFDETKLGVGQRYRTLGRLRLWSETFSVFLKCFMK